MGECTAEDRDVEGSIPSCGTLIFFLLWETLKIEYRLAALLPLVICPRNFSLYKNLEKLSHIMINKKDFPVIIFQSKSLSPTGVQFNFLSLPNI
jgi:hypothetical protein